MNQHPQVKGRCFACGGETLFVGEGGYITCSYLSCPDPSVVNRFLLVEVSSSAKPAEEEFSE